MKALIAFELALLGWTTINFYFIDPLRGRWEATKPKLTTKVVKHLIIFVFLASLIPLVIGLLVMVDQSSHLFTLTAKADKEQFYKHPFDYPATLLVDLNYPDPNSPFPVEAQYYQLMTRRYEVVPPLLLQRTPCRCLTEIIMPTPTNGTLQVANDISYWESNRGRLGVSFETPRNVKVTGIQSNQSAENILISIRGYNRTEPAIINATYVKNSQPVV